MLFAGIFYNLQEAIPLVPYLQTTRGNAYGFMFKNYKRQYIWFNVYKLQEVIHLVSYLQTTRGNTFGFMFTNYKRQYI